MRPDFWIRLYDYGRPMAGCININTILDFGRLFIYRPYSAFAQWVKKNDLWIKTWRDKYPEEFQKVKSYFNPDFFLLVEDVYHLDIFAIKSPTHPLGLNARHAITVQSGGFSQLEIENFLIAIVLYTFPAGTGVLPTVAFVGGQNDNRLLERVIYFTEIKGVSIVCKITLNVKCYRAERNIYHELNDYLKLSGQSRLVVKIFSKDYIVRHMGDFFRLSNIVIQDTKHDIHIYKKLEPDATNVLTQLEKANLDIGENIQALWNENKIYNNFLFQECIFIATHNDKFYHTLYYYRQLEPNHDDFWKVINVSNQIKLMINIIAFLQDIKTSLGFNHWDIYSKNILIHENHKDFRFFDFDVSTTHKNPNWEFLERIGWHNAISNDAFCDVGFACDVFRLMMSFSIQHYKLFNKPEHYPDPVLVIPFSKLITVLNLLDDEISPSFGYHAQVIEKLYYINPTGYNEAYYVVINQNVKELLEAVNNMPEGVKHDYLHYRKTDTSE